MRPSGQILLDLEDLYEELIDQHEWQSTDILFNALGWCEVHRPESIPVYTKDGTSPVLSYRKQEKKKTRKQKVGQDEI